MSLSYDLTPDDYAAYWSYHYRHRRTGKGALRVLQFGFPALWVLLVLPVFLRGRAGVIEWAFAAFVLVWLLFLPAFVRQVSMRRMRRVAREGFSRGSVGPRQLDLTDEGLVEATPYGRHETHWRSVERLADTPDHLFVYTGPNAAYIVPKRALPDAGAGLRAEIETRLRQGAR